MIIPYRASSSRAVVLLLSTAAVAALTAAAAGLVPRPCEGEVVVLRDGRRLTGDVRLSGKEIVVARGMTTSYVPRTSVERIDLTAAEQAEFDRLRTGNESLDGSRDKRGAPGLCKIGQWLDDHFQYEQADGYYKRAIEADPNHAAARDALGFRRQGKEWVEDPAKLLARATSGFGASAADACVRVAKDLAAKGQAKGAETALRHALVANPQQAEALALIQPYLAGVKLKNSYRKPVEGKTVGLSAENHRTAAQMYNAVDFSKLNDAGRPYAGDGAKLEDYVVYGAPVLASAAGEVVVVMDGFPDQPVGQPGEFQKSNAVAIKHSGGEFTLYAHLKPGTITVRKGQTVKAGDVIGKVGNSGGTTAPHLHFCIFDSDSISLPVKFSDEAPKPGP